MGVWIQWNGNSGMVEWNFSHSFYLLICVPVSGVHNAKVEDLGVYQFPAWVVEK